MKRQITIAILAIFILSLILPAFASQLKEPFRFPPAPRLVYPISDEVVLSGKDFLEFKWLIRDFIDIDHYEFRLYKGYDMYASNLALKEQLPSDASSTKVKSEFFEENQVYTWSLRQVLNGGEKSDRSFQSFKVIK